MGKEGKEHFLERMNSVAELRRWSESDQEYMFNIILDYQKKLADEKKWDDIDLARAALKRVDNGEKYDEIFCDEAQDFTQIELALFETKMFDKSTLANQSKRMPQSSWGRYANHQSNWI